MIPPGNVACVGFWRARVFPIESRWPVNSPSAIRSQRKLRLISIFINHATIDLSWWPDLPTLLSEGAIYCCATQASSWKQIIITFCAREARCCIQHSFRIYPIWKAFTNLPSRNIHCMYFIIIYFLIKPMSSTILLKIGIKLSSDLLICRSLSWLISLSSFGSLRQLNLQFMSFPLISSPDPEGPSLLVDILTTEHVCPA